MGIRTRGNKLGLKRLCPRGFPTTHEDDPVRPRKHTTSPAHYLWLMAGRAPWPDVRRERLPRGCYKELKTNRAILLIEGLAAACEVSMADLHQTRNPNPNAGIDAVGWLFSAVAAAIIAVAALIAYEANDTRLANAPVSQIVAR